MNIKITQKDPIPLFKPRVTIDAAKAVASVCESGYLNEGIQVTQLERALSERLGAPNGQATLLNSCTSALELSLRLAGVGPGDNVITTSMTCVATNTPIVNAGASILWADIDPSTGCIDPNSVANLLFSHASFSSKVKAVVCVNWAGNVCDLEHLNQLCQVYDVKLIQDAAHAFGATFMGRPIAEQADYTCFSFQAIKHFTTGDGGMLVCRNPNDHARARRLKWFGLDRDAVKDSCGDWKGQQWDADIIEAGRKLNMNNIAAAIGLSNLPSIDWVLSRHRENAKVYDQIFENTDVMPLSLCGETQVSSRWVYTVRVDRHIRDELLARLNTHGIKAGLVHVPNHGYACFASSRRSLPGTDEFFETQLSLPCGWWMSMGEAHAVGQIVLEKINEIRSVAS